MVEGNGRWPTIGLKLCTRLGSKVPRLLPVPVVSDPASIVALPRAVCDGIIRDIRVLVNKHLQLSHADTQVRLVEPVRDIPTEGTKLASLLY